MLTVSEVTSLGMPASICAWREGIWPWPACSTWPITTCWTCAPSTPARSSAASMAIAPSLVAGREDETAAELSDGGPGSAEDHGVGHARSTLVFAPSHGRPRHHRGARRRRARTRSRSGCSRTRGSRTTRPAARSARSSTRARPSPAFRKLALTHAEGKRWIVAGLGKRDEFDPERARAVAGSVIARARELGARSLCWELPHHVSDTHAAALRRGQRDGRLRVHDVQERRRRGRRRHARRAGRLRPPRRRRARRARPRRRRVREPRARPPEPPRQRPHADRADRARAARSPSRHDTVTLEVMGRAEIEAAGMGAFAGVAQGTYEEPQLITLRYDGPDATGPGARLRRQGGDVRLRRHLDQARQQDERHEVRHVGRRRRARRDRRDRAPRAPRARHRRGRRDREPALGPLDEARRHPARPQRHDDRGHQHRRRGPARARRLPAPRGRAGRRAARRPRHADRRHRDDARHHLRRADGPGRRLVRGGRGRRAGAPARSCGGCRCTPSTPS